MNTNEKTNNKKKIPGILIVILTIVFTVPIIGLFCLINYLNDVDQNLEYEYSLDSMPEISNDFQKPIWDYCNIGYKACIYIGCDSSTNWKLFSYDDDFSVNKKIYLKNENKNLSMDISIINNPSKELTFLNNTNNYLSKNELNYIYKRDITINDLSGNIYVLKDGKCNLYLKLNDDYILECKTTKTDLDEKNIALEDLNSLIKLFEEDDIQSIFKTLTLKIIDTIYTSDNNRYIKLGEIKEEKYNLSIMNGITYSTIDQTINNKIDIVTDNQESLVSIFIDKTQKITMNNKNDRYTSRYSTFDTFDVPIQTNIACRGSIINKDSFTYLLNLYEHYANATNAGIKDYNSTKEEKTINDFKTYNFMDYKEKRFYTIICLNEEKELYLEFMCYDPTNSVQDFDIEKAYNSESFQNCINSIKSESITESDYNKYMNSIK